MAKAKSKNRKVFHVHYTVTRTEWRPVVAASEDEACQIAEHSMLGELPPGWHERAVFEVLSVEEGRPEDAVRHRGHTITEHEYMVNRAQRLRGSPVRARKRK